ncbi:MAG: 2,3-bisphosphoglycerate-independent phosphoglycerate mutase [Sphaerobacter sp.]|nr:2,3-bisphosphoglycerate-independent phosphoglycerate mutase [Sphaerobacter sp.]
MAYRPVVLVILDGWANGPDYPGNAVLAARTPVMDRLTATYPTTALRCSGRDVGLPNDQMGNSEVGHLNLGAGFVVYQWITRIDAAIEDGSFFENPVLVGAVEHARQHGTALHLLGLVSDGGVHSHQRHLYALLDLAHRHGLERVFIHAFTDGRDTPPDSGAGFIQQLVDEAARIGTGRIATISGRYYAMDRDKRWERTAKAYDAIVGGIGVPARDPVEAVRASYDAGVTDEFIVPIVLQEGGRPVATVNDGDAVIFFNFRADRARQLTQAMTDPEFNGFARRRVPQGLHFVTMTEYERDFTLPIAFPPQDVVHPLARVLAEAGLRQYHTAETEKYAHVTYFFNGGREEPFPGEDRVLIPSPKVATYDLKPEMSAIPLTDRTVETIQRGEHDFIIINYANGDMVGHTGVFEAAVRAVETVDRCVGRLVEATLGRGGVIIVTADHGNADEMLIPGTTEVWTAHTKNPVPFVLVAPDDSPLRHVRLRSGGRLADVAPTVLDVMGLTPPADMTGRSLIERSGA